MKGETSSESVGGVKEVERPNIHTMMRDIAKAIARRSTCDRRAVGCVLADVQGRVLATGYNGVARGLPHCVETPCEGASSASGTNLDKCEAIHAEQNALMFCKNIDEIHVAYCTTQPCVHCTKMLLNTPCKAIIFGDFYDDVAYRLWVNAGRSFHVFEDVCND